MADVSHGHDQAPALAPAGHRLAVDRVVEVTRVGSVDRHQRHVAQVDAAAQIAWQHRIRQALRKFDRRRRKLVRYRELADRDLDLHARVVDGAQHFDDPPHRLHVALRLLKDLDDHDLAGLRREGRSGRNKDVVLDALVFGHDDGDAAFVEQAADELVGAALDNLDDLALGAAAAVGAGDARQDAVAMQHLAHLVLGEHEILAGIVADQESEAVAMALHLARDEVGTGGHEEQPGAIADHAARTLEFLELFVEKGTGLVGNMQPVGQFVRGQRSAGAGQRLQDRIAIDDG